jgi:Flp pilus assembly secretin CpaC
MSGTHCTQSKVRNAIVAIASGLIAAISHAQAADLVVRYDQSQLLRLPRSVAEVIIGNPSIADVAVQGGNLLVVTGKSFGVTNIIALDADRNVIQDQRVVVDRDDQRMLAVYRGSARQTYSCAPTCSPAFVMGDDTKIFEAMSKAVQTKKAISTPARSSQQAE